MGPGQQEITVRKPDCCQEMSRTISADSTGGPLNMFLSFLPGSITPLCSVPGVIVKIDKGPGTIGRQRAVIMDSVVGTEKVVVVEFLSADKTDRQVVRVPARKDIEVTCQF